MRINITQKNYSTILLFLSKSVKAKKTKSLLRYIYAAFRRGPLGKKLANFLTDFNKSPAINMLKDSSKKRDICTVSWP